MGNEGRRGIGDGTLGFSRKNPSASTSPLAFDVVSVARAFVLFCFSDLYFTFRTID